MKKHDKKVKKEQVKRDNTFILVDSPTWRSPEHLDLESLRDIMEISKGKNSFVNVFAYKFKDQDTEPTLPPGSHKLDKSLELAADDNFLYVWVKNRWKRIPLTEF